MVSKLCPRGHIYSYQHRRCPVCSPVQQRRRDARRGTPTERGYGYAHQAARAALKETLPAPCGYGCGRLLEPGGQWVAAHRVDGHPEYGYIPSCRTCNERAKRRPSR